MTLSIPFGATAHVKLPRSENVTIMINNHEIIGGQFDLTAGTYTISYQPNQDYIERYSAETPAAEIMSDAYLVEKIDKIDPILDFFRNDPDALNGGLGKLSLKKLNEILPFITISQENLDKIVELLEATPVISQRKD